MLNRALRLVDVGIIIKIGFFICDLHRQIEQLHNEQFTSKNSSNKFPVYRGQGMWNSDGIGSCFFETEPNRTEKISNRTEPNRLIF
jgi:hypothetical protein